MATTIPMKQPRHAERIVTDPKVHGGQPAVRDTGVPVERILAQLATKPDVGDTLARIPNRMTEDIKAVMDYERAAVEAVTASDNAQDI